MFIIKHKKIFIGISAALVILSIASLLVFGLRIGIDFKGGSLIEVAYSGARPEQPRVIEALNKLELDSVLVQPTGEAGYIIKTRDITEAEHRAILAALPDAKSATETSFNSIGPSIGRELTTRAAMAIVFVSLAIICFIAFAFRGVSRPVSSWKYGLIAIVSLLHDVLIPIGIFSVLSYYWGAEVDTLFVVAVLTVLGLSVSDTIVVFDRIRENLKNRTSVNFSEVVGKSIEQVFARSIATSLTVILVLLSLFFFGPDTTRYFALMMTAGMFFGTYSSIFLASPLLVLVEEWQRREVK